MDRDDDMPNEMRETTEWVENRQLNRQAPSGV